MGVGRDRIAASRGTYPNERIDSTRLDSTSMVACCIDITEDILQGTFVIDGVGPFDCKHPIDIASTRFDTLRGVPANCPTLSEVHHRLLPHNRLVEEAQLFSISNNFKLALGLSHTSLDPLPSVRARTILSDGDDPGVSWLN